jgi:uncharacterized delta-60 repeat protein
VSASGAVAVAGNALRSGSGARLVRLLPNGLLDPSFGVGGVAVLPMANDLAIQLDEKIVVGTATVSGAAAVARYRTDGRLDLSYGDAGFADTGFSDALAFQSDGKLVVGGFLRREGIRFGAAVLRLLDDGHPDPTFGVGGISPPWAPINAVDLIQDLAIQPAGEIVVTGTSHYGKQTSWFVHRVGPSGASLGPSVGGAGYPQPERDCWGDYASSIAVQPDGKILVGGGTCDADVLARYLPDLRLDADGTKLSVRRAPPSTSPIPIGLTGRRRVAMARVSIDHAGTVTATVRPFSRKTGGIDWKATPLVLLPGTLAGKTTLRGRAREVSVSLSKAGVVKLRLLLPAAALQPKASYALVVRARDTRSRNAVLQAVLRAP